MLDDQSCEITRPRRRPRFRLEFRSGARFGSCSECRFRSRFGFPGRAGGGRVDKGSDLLVKGVDKGSGGRRLLPYGTPSPSSGPLPGRSKLSRKPGLRPG
ncbi:hypothetical protein Kpho02_76330 [Kitasatospora phosalacinea]|uniref:Uncharacterized protein n=1 Tax=Kitasatospora phosalacinea TaxID=2065 RepID=A0A9W6QI36_9ACTN|nr:hypothetical protein Kpho02_76330 [Kitasatospora phosalacinea]